MKKVLIVLIAILGFASCSSDDDGGIIIDNAELIIGEWSPTRFVHQVDGEIITDNQANSCQIQSRDKYYENGDYIRVVYGGSLPNNCDVGNYSHTYSVDDDVMLVPFYSNPVFYIEIENDVITKRWGTNIHYYKREL